VLDKGRGVGGRTSTRRGAQGTFDHGAPSFHATDARLAPWLEAWCDEGILQATAHGYRGRPGMNALARHLTSELDVQVGTTVRTLRRTTSGWEALDADGRAWAAARLAVAVPAPQGAALLRSAGDDAAERLAQRLDTVEMAPNWCAMVVLDGPLPARAHALLDGGELPPACTGGDPRLARVVREAEKPGRPSDECWTVQADAGWSAAHLEADASWVAETLGRALRDALLAALGAGTPEVAHTTAHRWRFARVTRVVEAACLWEPDAGVGAAGDFGTVPDVAGAWLSGVALAGRLLGG
jgi:hypothetical protein